MTRLLFRYCAVGITALLSRTGGPPGSAPGTARIPFERYTLPNGLTVVLSEDRSIPTVAVDVWYHVGSKNEHVGRTGFAHLFEHLMFTGSGHVPYGTQDRLTEGVGGQNNGSTTNDRTNYYESVPSNYLEDELWIEADRMGFLLDSLTQSKLDAQRDVVKNERRQSYDNQPYGRSGELISAAMYPAGHPYQWPVIGSMVDLSAASLDDVKQFFRFYYAPNNATLTIVGDFEPAQAKAWVTKYFGDLPKGAPITRPTVPSVPLSAVKRIVYQDRVPLARLTLAWPIVGEPSPDHVALSALADVLAGARTSRLTKVLVYDRQWAATVTAFAQSNEKAGEFKVVITPRPGHSLTELELAADTIINRLRREGPTADEVKRATASAQFDFVSGLESNLGKAETLANGQVFHGNPGYFATELALTKALTASDIKRAATTYLTPGRVVLSVVPIGQLDSASKAAPNTEVK